MSKMTGTALVVFAHEKIGTPYVYGMKGKVMTEANFNYLYNTYGSKYVPWSDRKKIGQVCVDCSGLISWACGVQLGSSQWKDRAVREGHVYPVSTIKDAPVGALLWQNGHIGIYAGMEKGVPMYIAADGSAYGTRKAAVSKSKFTHWLMVPSIFEYEEDEMVEKDTIIVNGKKHQVDMIRKDGVTFVKTRDIAEALGMKVSSQGKVPVLQKA